MRALVFFFYSCGGFSRSNKLDGRDSSWTGRRDICSRFSNVHSSNAAAPTREPPEVGPVFILDKIR